MNPVGEEVRIVHPVSRTGANEGSGNTAQPARVTQPAAPAPTVPNTRPPGPTRVPAPIIRSSAPTRPPVSNPSGPTRTAVPIRGNPRPTPRPAGAPHPRYKIGRISTLRRFCLPVTTAILILASLVVIGVLIKVVLDNYYYFCSKSFKFIPLDKWCDGQSDCANNEDEERCVQRVDFSSGSFVRFTDVGSLLQIFSSGQWSYICYNGFDTSQAKSVCAQLGYSSDPSFTMATTSDPNGLFGTLVQSGSGFQAIPISGSCPFGTVVSLRCIACGANHKKERIIGGTDSVIDTWPWQVSMQYMGQHACGGSILTSKIILTAAHCFQKAQQQVDRWRVEAGHSSLKYLFASQLDKIFIPKLYILDQKPYDIAIVKLKNDLSFSASVQPVCLPGFDNSLTEGTSLSVTGWGNIAEGGALASTLQEVSISLISNNVCNRQYYGQILDTMLCAGRLSGGLDTCQGDSGGPLVWLGDNSLWEQVGVVSWGDGCGRPGKVGVYTRLTSYLPWVYGIMKNEL